MPYHGHWLKQSGVLRMIEIGRDEYDELLDMATRLSIITEMLKTEKNYIDADLLRLIVGLTPKGEKDV